MIEIEMVETLFLGTDGNVVVQSLKGNGVFYVHDLAGLFDPKASDRRAAVVHAKEGPLLVMVCCD